MLKDTGIQNIEESNQSKESLTDDIKQQNEMAAEMDNWSNASVGRTVEEERLLIKQQQEMAAEMDNWSNASFGRTQEEEKLLIKAQQEMVAEMGGLHSFSSLKTPTEVESPERILPRFRNLER